MSLQYGLPATLTSHISESCEALHGECVSAETGKMGQVWWSAEWERDGGGEREEEGEGDVVRCRGRERHGHDRKWGGGHRAPPVRVKAQSIQIWKQREQNGVVWLHRSWHRPLKSKKKNRLWDVLDTPEALREETSVQKKWSSLPTYYCVTVECHVHVREYGKPASEIPRATVRAFELVMLRH